MSNLYESVQKLLSDWGSGIFGGIGLTVSKLMDQPKELLLWLSIIAVSFQIIHSLRNFCSWGNYFWQRILKSRRTVFTNKNKTWKKKRKKK